MKTITQILTEWTYPAYTADIVIIKDSQILLIKRKNDPYKNMWALPGGFVDEGETPLEAAKRELKEETNLVVKSLTYVGKWDKDGRDPRGKVVTTAFKAIVDGDVKPKAGDDAKEIKWFDIDELPQLAFDHKDIIAKAL